MNVQCPTFHFCYQNKIPRQKSKLGGVTGHHGGKGPQVRQAHREMDRSKLHTQFSLLLQFKTQTLVLKSFSSVVKSTCSLSESAPRWWLAIFSKSRIRDPPPFSVSSGSMTLVHINTDVSHQRLVLCTMGKEAGLPIPVQIKTVLH